MLTESELFIEIEAYVEHIKLSYRKQGTPNDNIKRALGKAYDASVLTKHKTDKTCMGCSNDFAHMIGQLYGVIERVGNKPIKLEPKIPKLKPIKEDVVWDDNVQDMKWGAFKSYCKAKGINVKGKTKEQLLKELGIS